MGLDPVSQSMPTSLISSTNLDSPPQLSLSSGKLDYKSEQLVNLLSAAQSSPQIQISASPASSLAAGTINSAQSPQIFPVSSVGLLEAGGMCGVNGGGSPADGVKKAPILNHKLNGTEIAAVRQLITGYRESAAFLLRSADELEHLITVQTKL